MKTKFICLGNSFKEGGRCLAGIELDEDNNPVLIHGRPKWIRPVCHTPHEEVPTHLVSDIDVLDIIKIKVTQRAEEKCYQSENAFFEENSIKIKGRYTNDLVDLCDNRKVIFGNRGKAVPEDAISDLNYSLMLIKTDEFEVIEKVYDDCQDRPQKRLLFQYRNNQYNFPITDPVFLHKHQRNPDFLNNTVEIFLSLSLGICWNDWYYKLVAAIIPRRN